MIVVTLAKDMVNYSIKMIKIMRVMREEVGDVPLDLLYMLCKNGSKFVCDTCGKKTWHIREMESDRTWSKNTCIHCLTIVRTRPALYGDD